MERKIMYKTLSVLICVILVLVIFGLLSYFFVFQNNTALTVGPKMVIDHDGGADDSMAIFMALLYEKYFDGPKVVGLTTNHGNVNETQVYINSQRFLTVVNRLDVPIYRGNTKSLIYSPPSDVYYGYDGLGDNDDVSHKIIPAQDKHAVLGLIELSKLYEGDLIVVCLGSLTNIALAVSLDSEFIQRLSHLYIGAGNIYSDTYKEAEYNAAMDVEAYHIVGKNALPDKVTAIPFSQIYLSQHITREWRKDVLGAIPTELMRIQNSYERLILDAEEMWTQLDPAVMAMVLEPSVVTETKYSEHSIILCGDKRGINTNNFTKNSEANVRVVYDTSDEIYKTLLYDIFSAELGTNNKKNIRIAHPS